MRTKQNKVSFPLKNALWCAGLALVLAGARVAAAPGETTKKPQAIVPVFRLDGPLSEAPEGDASLIFGGSAESLKELVGRLAEAAADRAVKGVVILPEGTPPGTAQIEELRAAMSLAGKQGKR